MRRSLFTLLFVVAACGGVSGEPAPDIPPEPETTTSSQPHTTTTVESSGETDTTESVEEESSASSELPLAPDFTLELGTGGEYTLSEGDKPVYLVFWAEW